MVQIKTASRKLGNKAGFAPKKILKNIQLVEGAAPLRKDQIITMFEKERVITEASDAARELFNKPR